jgi:hypothetical protein
VPHVFTPFDLLKPPESYHEACSRPDVSGCREAMEHKIDSLCACQAFEPADLPHGCKAIGVC